MKYRIKILISEKEISRKIIELGKSISSFYNKRKNKLILIGLLRGSFIFISDLCRSILFPHEIDFITVSSYGKNICSTKKIKIIQDLNADIYNKDVLIIEDIIDSGKTINKIYKIFSLRNPKSIYVCTLLNKSIKRKLIVPIKWFGFIIPDEFIVGYGIDYAQKYRYLPYIGKILIK